MRRAIGVATGYDPAHDFVRCPVHVVVMASYVGPVPYELQDVYPANVRAGGVKHMGEEEYVHARSASGSSSSATAATSWPPPAPPGRDAG